MAIPSSQVVDLVHVGVIFAQHRIPEPFQSAARHPAKTVQSGGTRARDHVHVHVHRRPVRIAQGQVLRRVVVQGTANVTLVGQRFAQRHAIPHHSCRSKQQKCLCQNIIFWQKYVNVMTNYITKIILKQKQFFLKKKKKNGILVLT